ncbi:MAG: hypothetical protein GY898_29050 [Proteobacteria bacterium]|nr:hypothetical protein [Pseudomonadota bacterium]
MKRTPFALLAGAAAVTLLGCPPVYFQSDAEIFVFQTGNPGDDDDSVAESGVYVEPWHGFRNVGPVLAGTTICWQAEPNGGSGLGGDVWPGCFDTAWTGDVTVDGRCHTFGVGDATFTLTPREDCLPIDPTQELAADAVTVTTIDADGLTLELLRYAEMAAADGAVAGDTAPWPSEWPAPFTSPLRVVAGEPVLVHAGLYHPDHAGAVAFNSGDAVLTVESIEGDSPELVPLYDDPAAQPEDGPFAPSVRMVLAEGASVRLRLDLGGDSWTTGDITAVPEADIVSLSVVPAYSIPWVSEEDDSGGDDGTGLPFSPLGARAVALDADGNEVLGGNVRWSVGGATIQLVPGTEPGPISYFPMPGNDYVWLNDGCLPPDQAAGQRRSTLKVALGDLSDSIVLTWERPGREHDPEYERPDTCTGGCACDASGPVGGTPLAALGLFAVMTAVRRRRASA